eukprot:TRINITY_DN11868_c0_g1_i6.p1 TRINITY_DN11868_c0_g1~~TRINITY_DN11868_c0_g1_i6.p1  ORF type:complete len:420 (-),score=14.00 TRINITY_DN11868_c0_g1_i6:45-1304(-)
MTIITCATGRHPLPTNNGFWDVHSALSEQGPPTLPETFSKPIRDFVKCCLVPDPRKRFGAEALLKHGFCLSAPSLEATLQYWPAKLKMGAAPAPKIEADVRKTLRGLSRISLIRASSFTGGTNSTVSSTATTSTSTTRRAPPPAPPGEKPVPKPTQPGQPSKGPSLGATGPPPRAAPKPPGDLLQPSGTRMPLPGPGSDALSHLQIMGSIERCNKPKSLSHDPATCNCKVVLKIKKPLTSALTSPIPTSPPTTASPPPPLPSTQAQPPRKPGVLGLPASSTAQDPISPPPRPPSRGSTRPSSSTSSSELIGSKDGPGGGRALSPPRPGTGSTVPSPRGKLSGSSVTSTTTTSSSPPPVSKTPVFPMAVPLPKKDPPPRPPPVPSRYGRSTGGGEVLSPVKSQPPQPPSYPKSPPPKPKP